MLLQFSGRRTPADPILGHRSGHRSSKSLDCTRPLVYDLPIPIYSATDSARSFGPDHCDGTYDQYCDETRQYTNISAILSSYGRTSLLSYMETYWKDQGGNDESFWEHEWGKHGTCVSTLNTKCYVNYKPQQEVVDYFQKTIDLFKTLDSYKFLAIAGIVPSTTKTYSSAQVQKALGLFRGGVNASIECGGAGKNELQQIYYHFHVAGSAQDGIYIPTQPGKSLFSPTR